MINLYVARSTGVTVYRQNCTTSTYERVLTSEQFYTNIIPSITFLYAVGFCPPFSVT